MFFIWYLKSLSFISIVKKASFYSFKAFDWHASPNSHAPVKIPHKKKKFYIWQIRHTQNKLPPNTIHLHSLLALYVLISIFLIKELSKIIYVKLKHNKETPMIIVHSFMTSNCKPMPYWITHPRCRSDDWKKRWRKCLFIHNP